MIPVVTNLLVVGAAMLWFVMRQRKGIKLTEGPVGGVGFGHPSSAIGGEMNHALKINNDDIDANSNPNCGYMIVTSILTNLLVLLTVGGVVLGVILGLVLRNSRDWSERDRMYIRYVGDIFLQMLKSLILPLIVSSLISAISNLDLTLSGKIAARAICYYLSTTFAAVVLGIILVTTINPGAGVVLDDITDDKRSNALTIDTLLDLGRSMFPANILEACIFQFHTKLEPIDNQTDKYHMRIEKETIQSTNILGLVVASVAIGVALVQLGEEGKPVAKFFTSLMAVMMKITTWVIWLSPIGVMFLVTHEVIKMNDFSSVVASLGRYFGTVILGLCIHGFMVLPTIYFILTRCNPIKFVSNMAEAITTAFGTASSSATLPVTIRCLEANVGVDKRVARFALPIGATINMDGTALYEAVAALFIAQARGVEMSLGTMIAVSITATAAAIGAAGIPQAGMITMVMVLDTVGLPPSDVSLILGIDWCLDRCRTAVNVMGDAYGATIVAHRSHKELKKHIEDINTVS